MKLAFSLGLWFSSISFAEACNDPNNCITVLVAKLQIDYGELLSPEMFTVESRPRAEVPGDVLTEPYQVDGTFAKILIKKGTPIRALEITKTRPYNVPIPIPK